jgi:hypothetical protein
MTMRILLTVVLTVMCHGPARADEPTGAATVEQTPAKLKDKADEVQRRRLEASLDQAAVRLAKLQAEVRETEAQLRKKTGRTDVSPDSLRQTASRTENELEALELDTAGSTARLQALTAAIAEVAKKGEEAAKNDEVTKQLMEVVAARDQELQMKQKMAEQATISQAEIMEARARRAEAMAKLAERRTAVAASAGGGALADWNREMLDLSLDAQERQARTAILKDRLEHLKAGFDDVDRLEELKAAQADARARVAELQREFR